MAGPGLLISVILYIMHIIILLDELGQEGVRDRFEAPHAA
jgi:hypothetical protein